MRLLLFFIVALTSLVVANDFYYATTREDYAPRTVFNFCYASNIARERDCQKLQDEDQNIWVSWNRENINTSRPLCFADKITTAKECTELASFLKDHNVTLQWSNTENLCILPDVTTETNCLDHMTPMNTPYTIWTDNSDGICDITSITNKENCEQAHFEWFNIHQYKNFQCSSQSLPRYDFDYTPYDFDTRSPLNPTFQEAFVINDLGTVVGQLLSFTGADITIPANCSGTIELCLEIDLSIDIESPEYVQYDFGKLNVSTLIISPQDLDAFVPVNTSIVCANITMDGFYYPILRVNDTIYNWRNLTIDICGVYFGNNDTCDDCLGTPGGNATEDVCGICNGNGTSCLDCAGTPNGTATFDQCGVCDGDDSTCLDCQLVPNGNATSDACGVCNGDNSSCADCAGIPNGLTCVDACNVCNGTGDCRDCFGVLNGDAVLDICNVCNGTNTTCLDCLGVPNGNATEDVCGVCNGNGTSCLDCAGVPNGNTLLDACNVCGGDNSTCAGCDCVPNSGVVEDVCGVCGGDNSTCIGCDGNPSIPVIVRDVCGVCGGDGTSCNATDPFCVNVTCSANGVCEPGVGICQCFNGFTGPDCSEIDLCFGVLCGLHGECNTTTGDCDCAPGFSGPICDTEIPDLCEDVDCGAFGSCNPGTGFCECVAGYTGCRCTEIDCGVNGFYSVVDDECICIAGYTGATCDQCQSTSVGGKTFLCVPTDAFITNAALVAVPDAEVLSVIDTYGAFPLDEAGSNGLSCNCIPLVDITSIATGTAADQCERRAETLTERAHVQIERINELFCHIGTVLTTGGAEVTQEDETGQCFIIHWRIVVVLGGINLLLWLAVIGYILYYNYEMDKYTIFTAALPQPQQPPQPQQTTGSSSYGRGVYDNVQMKTNTGSYDQTMRKRTKKSRRNARSGMVIVNPFTNEEI